jgi:HSP20 family molecular chaperone IbpA
MSTPTELEAAVTKASSKLDSAVVLLYEKVAREYELTPDEVRSATVTIKNGVVTVKVKGKKDE